MRVVITGGCGFLGRRVALQLLARGDVDELVLFDNAPSALPLPEDKRLSVLTGDIADSETVRRVISGGTHSVFHLAAVVSGQAEADTDLGYRVNLDGTRAVLDACRALGTCPRVVFASSLAVYGGTLPPAVGDETPLTPQTSYGTQKAIGELLLSDYSRRGFLDGVGIRLPTICVRPGEPNQAASGFFSSIIREPLNDEEAVLPVPEDVRHWFASPRAAVDFLLHAAAIESAALGDRRCLTMPGVSETVAGQIAALQNVAGDAVVRLIRREPDETIMRIVAGWPRKFDARRALELGFRAEVDFAEIVRVYVEDELGGRIGGRES